MRMIPGVLVKKRDGHEVPYVEEKIAAAIAGAFEDFGEEFDDPDVLRMIEWKLKEIINSNGHAALPVEQIQDVVEDKLLDMGYRKQAKAYIRYRHEHELARKAKIERDFEDKLLAKKIDNQNANVDEHSFGGRMGEANSVQMKEYALYHCMSKMARENHLNNEIYEHDLDQYAIGSHNCLSIPFDKLLANGFNTRQTDVRPANSLNTAFQLVAVIFQLQSLQQFGGVSATHLDWTMVPYVQKSFYKHFADGLKYIANSPKMWVDIDEELSIDSSYYKQCPEAYKYAMDMTKKECYQAVEGLFHNLKY